MCRGFLSVEWFGHKTYKRTATLDDKCEKSLKSGQIAVHKEIRVHNWPVSPDCGRIAAELAQMKFAQVRSTRNSFIRLIMGRNRIFTNRFVTWMAPLSTGATTGFLYATKVYMLMNELLHKITLFYWLNSEIDGATFKWGYLRAPICYQSTFAHEWVARFARNSFIRPLTEQNRIFSLT